jgi:hypothetical protein
MIAYMARLWYRAGVIAILRRLFTLIAGFILAGIMAGAGRAAASTAPTAPPPALSIVGPSSVSLLLTGYTNCVVNLRGKPTKPAPPLKAAPNHPEKPRKTPAPGMTAEPGRGVTPGMIPKRTGVRRGGCWYGTVTIAIEDNGAPVNSYSVKAVRYPTLSSKLIVDDTTVKLPKHPPHINAYGVTSIPVKVLIRDNWSSSLTLALVAQSPAGVDPVVTTILIVRQPRSSDYWWPIIIGILFSVIFTGWIFITSIADKKNFSDEIYTSSSWSFKDSWVSTLTALGAVAGTVLGATGFLTDVFPGVDTQRFFSLLILFTGAVLTAPLAYTAASKTDAKTGETLGTVGGLLLATAVTLFGVAGQFATLGSLVWLADTGTGTQVEFTVAIGIVGLIVGWYAHNTADQLTKLTEDSLAENKKGPTPIL